MIFAYRPNDLRVDATVFMPQQIAERVNFSPWHFVALPLQFIGNVLGCLRDNKQGVLNRARHTPDRRKDFEVFACRKRANAGDLGGDIVKVNAGVARQAQNTRMASRSIFGRSSGCSPRRVP